MDFGLKGRSALVTGGSRGIGRAVVLALASEGASVTVCYAHESPAVASLARSLEQLDADAHLVRADVSVEADVEALFEALGERSGSLDVLVNNAAVVSHHPVRELTVAEWRRVLDTNLTGMFLVSRAADRLLSDGASVVNVGSAGSLRGVADRAHYMASKAGAIGLTRSLCKELGPRGIRVNLVAAGYTDTDQMAGMSAARRAAAAAKTALGRVARPEEVAAAVLFLASDAAGYVTGETLHVDGGI